jgi:hypothetical protein
MCPESREAVGNELFRRSIVCGRKGLQVRILSGEFGICFRVKRVENEFEALIALLMIFNLEAPAIFCTVVYDFRRYLLTSDALQSARVCIRPLNDSCLNVQLPSKRSQQESKVWKAGTPYAGSLRLGDAGDRGTKVDGYKNLAVGLVCGHG